MSQKLYLVSWVIFFSQIGWAQNPIPLVWSANFLNRVEKIDAQFDGDLGVYVKCLTDGALAQYKALEYRYLASTIKIPVAIVLMKEVEAKRINLKQKMTLNESDFIDGSGEVIWKKPGTTLEIGYLLEQMLKNSDSTATDILIRLLGTSKINSFLSSIDSGFEDITTLLQVRYDAYSELHGQAPRLTNLQIIDLKKSTPQNRPKALAKMLNVPVTELKTQSLDEAFERYYASRKNSGTLVAFGTLLEKFYRNELLQPASTQLLLKHMESMTTGEKRIKNGLPAGYIFAQKTGTQNRRICNVGIIRSGPNPKGLVVAACAEKFSEQEKADEALAGIGRALQESLALKCVDTSS